MMFLWPIWFIVFMAHDGFRNYLQHVIKYIRGEL